MRKFYLAGLFSGFIGGLLGAYVLFQVERPGSGAHPPQLLLRSRRSCLLRGFGLIDASGRARAELAFSQGGGPGSSFTMIREETDLNWDCIRRVKVNIHTWC